MNYWLMKSEPETFSIRDLAAAPRQTTAWDGVRNYQARNFMQAMRKGDRVLFYHSSADPTAVVGTATVAREAYPDSSAWTKNDPHFDPKASADNPIWHRVDIRFESELARPVTLEELRTVKALDNMVLLKKGRLSVQPVTKREFETILKLAKQPASKAEQPAAKKAASAPGKKKGPTKKAAKKKTAARRK